MDGARAPAFVATASPCKAAVSRLARGCRFQYAPRPAARGGPQPRHWGLDSGSPQPPDHGANGDREIVVGLRLRPERVSPRLLGDVRPGAAAAPPAGGQSGGWRP